MGGEVLELWPDRAKRLADEAYACGFKEGYEEIIDELSAKMIELGVDEALIEEIASSIKAERSTA
ncbi:MAG: hypothetical protein Q4B54_04965 [Coriobacteriales bacterium]|nr:hypothetical protein [Coriobacteriales bacterium]